MNGTLLCTVGCCVKRIRWFIWGRSIEKGACSSATAIWWITARIVSVIKSRTEVVLLILRGMLKSKGCVCGIWQKLLFGRSMIDRVSVKMFYAPLSNGVPNFFEVLTI